MTAVLLSVIMMGAGGCNEVHFAAGQVHGIGAGITPEAVIAACTEPGEMKRVEQPLIFKENTATCRFGQDGNLERRDQYFQARSRKNKSVNLPTDAIVCQLDITSRGNQLHYDDMLFFAVNDLVLSGSHQVVVEKLETKGGYKNWNFEKNVAGMRVTLDRNNATYCAPGVSCDLPPHDVRGGFSLNIDTDAIAPLVVALERSPDLTFSLIAGGDNDNGDCYYSAFELDASFRYVVP